MTCAACPIAAGPCIGLHQPHLCPLAAEHDHWRRAVVGASAGLGGLPTPPADPPPARELWALLKACPDRGGVLPLSLQDTSGCCGGGPELSGCRAGKGAVAGRVTLRDCLACAGAWPPVVLRGEVSAWTSYGRIARHLGAALEELGRPVAYREALRQTQEGPPVGPWVGARLGLPSPLGWYVQFQEPFTGIGGPGRKVSFTMNESSVLAPAGAAAFATSELVVVPTAACAAAFAAGGIDPDRLRVVPLGLCDAADFAPRAAPPAGAGPATFGMAGRQMHGRLRKGFDLGVAAFRAAFPRGDEAARLLVRTSDDLPIATGGDPRIEVDRRVSGAAELGDWYRALDAYLCPSRGEGWGMHTHEAMACGVPPIVAPWGGATGFCDPSCSYPVDFRLVPCGEPDLLNAGEWCEPSVAGMAARLREVHADRAGAFELGRRAAARAHALTWEASARALLAALAEFGFRA